MKLLGLAGALCAGSAMAAPPLADYGKLPAVEQMRLSPSGDQLAFVAVVGEARKLVVESVAGEVRRVVDAGAMKVRQIDWRGDDHVLIVTSATFDLDPAAPVGKAEIGQTAVLDVATGKLATVFAGEPLIMHATFGEYGSSRSGDKIYGYFAGLPLSGSGDMRRDFDRGQAYLDKGYADLFKVDLDTGRASEKVGGGSALYGSDWVVGSDGAVVGQAQYEYGTGEWRLYGADATGAPIERRADPTG
ncbi:MAG: hypothetical protein ABI376_11580, partial [Caulobacteraceae bacterium]